MADETIKRLLVRLGISSAEWQAAVRDIRRQLDDINKQAKREAQERMIQGQKEMSLAKEKVAQAKREQVELQKTVTLERAKQALLQTDAAEIRKSVQQRILETAEVKKTTEAETAGLRIERERITLAKQRLSLQQAQARVAVQAAGGAAGGGPPILGGVLRGLAGVAGGGLAGGVLAGVVGGGGILMLVDQLTQGFVRLVQRVKAFVEMSGPLQQIRQQFEGLSRAAGIDAPVFLGKLQKATKDLVDDMALMRAANTLLRSGMKVNEDQIVRLTEATVGLARAQGRNAQDAVQALERSYLTGRYALLAYVTGVSRAALQVRGLSDGTGQAVRSQKEFEHVLKVLEARYKSMGEPQLTLTERLTQLRKVTGDLFDSFAKGVAESGGLRAFMDLLGSVLDLLKRAAPGAEALGAKIGGLMGVMVEGFQKVGLAMSPVVEAVGALLVRIVELNAKIQNFVSEGIGSNYLQSVSLAAQKLTSFAGVVSLLTEGFMRLGAATRYWKTLAEGAAEGGVFGFGTAINLAREQFEKDMDEIDGMIKEMDERMQGYASGQPGNTKTGKPSPTDSQEQARKLAAMELQVQKAKEEEMLAAVRNRIEREKVLLDQQYADSLTTIENYINDRKKQEVALLGLKEGEIRNDAIRKGKEIDLETSTGAEKKKKRTLLESQTNLAIENLRAAHYATVAALDRQLVEDQKAAARTRVESLNRLDQMELQSRKQTLEIEAAKGKVTADQYIQRRIALIVEEEKLTVQGLQRRLELEKDNAAAIAQLNAAIVEAHARAEAAKTDITRNETALRLKVIQDQFEGRIAGATVAAARAPGMPGRPQEGLLKVQIDAGAAALKQLDRELDIAIKKHGEESKEAGEVAKKIMQARREQLGLNQELAKAKDILGPLASLFSTLADALSGISESLSKAFGDAAQVGGALAQYKQSPLGASGTGNIFYDAINDLTVLFKNTGTSFSEKVDNFIGTLQGLIGAISGFAKATFGAKSTGSGILGGGLAGLQLGAQFGPIGAAVGATVGAVLGGIIGSKRAAAEKELKRMKTAFEDVTKSLSNGLTTLRDAINQMERLQREAEERARETKEKKGGAEFQALADSIEAQLDQLRAQQRKLTEQMREQIKLLSAPEQYRDLLGSLNDIIKRYKEFRDAVQNVAEANKYLVLSLQAFIATQQRELMSAEMDAIENAIKLNELLDQRKKLLADSAKAEYDIMSRGILTRQRTVGQTKLDELRQVREQRDEQLKAIDKEIKLAQFKYDQERLVFNLATTRIGLETRLLELQRAQSQFELDRVRALQDLLARMSSVGLSSLTSLDAVLQLLGLAPGTATPGTTPGPALPGPGTPFPMPFPWPGPAPNPRGPGPILEMSGMAAYNTEQLNQEKTISSMVATRVGMEAELIRMREAEIAMDMKRIDALRSLIGQMQVTDGAFSYNDLESMLGRLYDQRGRYGAGGFSREYL